MDYAQEIIRQGVKQIPTHSRQEHDAMIAERDRLLALASLWRKPEGAGIGPVFACIRDRDQKMRIVEFGSDESLEAWCALAGATILYVAYESDLLATLPKEDAA